MYIVKMYDEEEMIKGYLTDDSEFGIRSEAAEFYLRMKLKKL